MPNSQPLGSSKEKPILNVVVDQPTDTLGLGYDKYVKALASVVLHGRPARYTVGIYGAWGVGKSSILSALEQQLKQDDLPVARFDAWRYARSANVLLPLLHEIDEALSKEGGVFWKSIGRGLRAITASLSVPTPIPGVSIADVSNAVAGATQAWREPGDRRRAEVPHHRLKEIGDDLNQDGKRIVVLIDDLDRCPPGTIVDILEAIHVLTDVQGFVFVMALDYDVLIRAIAEQYPTVDAAQFIEKIIQIPFSIPEVERSSVIIDEVVPDWQNLIGLQPDEAETFEKVVHLALRTNPRQVKRLVNAMLVAQYIVGDAAIPSSVLLGVIGLQLRWPAQFRDLHSILVANPDNDLLKDFETELAEMYSDDKLDAYFKAVLPRDLPRQQVFDAMKFSQTTASTSDGSVVDTDNAASDYYHEISPKHAEWFVYIEDLLLARGATFFTRQQYLGFKNGSRAFLRIDGYERVGIRLYFPDWMPVNTEDASYFGVEAGARGKNFSKTLILRDETKDIARRYAELAMDGPA